MPKKTKLYYIYLNEKDYKTLNDLKYKYHLSYSAIAQVVMRTLWPWSHILKADDEQIYKDGKKLTSIKPRNGNYTSRELDNCLKMFLRGDLKKYCKDEKMFNVLNNTIYNDLQKEYDENWNGNNFCRSMVRWLKKNKKYAQEIIDNE